MTFEVLKLTQHLGKCGWRVVYRKDDDLITIRGKYLYMTKFVTKNKSIMSMERGYEGFWIATNQ